MNADDDRKRRMGLVRDALVPPRPASPSGGRVRDEGRPDLPVVELGGSRKRLARRLV